MKEKKPADRKRNLELALLGALIALFGSGIVIMLFPSPKIVPEGGSSATVEVFSEYTDPGAHARFLFLDISDRIVCENRVDTTRVGRSEVRYSASFLLKTAVAARVVTVVDRTPPDVELVGESELHLEDLADFEDPGVTAQDNYDGDISDRVVVSHTETPYTEGERKGETEYTFTYSVTDSSGNAAFASRTVVTKDVTPPVITLNGEEVLSLIKGTTYEEQGATAEDRLSGPAEVTVSGEVDTSVTGTYAVKYTATDDAGNVAEKIRKVTVRDPLPAPETGTPLAKDGSYVALTFDDGPSSNTEAILDVLKQYNVKATFFILNYADAQIPLLRRIVREGHTLAIHSYSHEYSAIYTSADAYMQGVYTMHDKILRDTGYEATLIRFPGGSSNTVSKRYCAGVMTELAERADDEGFSCFDWNVDSGDADGYCMSKDYLIGNVKKGLKKGRVNVVLMHDSGQKTTTPQSLPDIISYAQNNGYTFIPLTPSVPPVRHPVSN